MADQVRLGDVMHHPSQSHHARVTLKSSTWRWVVVGFYQGVNGPQMVQLAHEDDPSVEYQAAESELVHADDAVVRLGRLAR